MKRIVVIPPADDTPTVCSKCGELKDCRPYTADGQPICFECSQLPENRAEVEKYFLEIITRDPTVPKSEQLN